MDIEVGNAKLGVRRLHSPAVLVETVHEHTLVDGPVSLGSLEALDTIVESGILGH